MKEYTIYHIPGIKVGCTADFKTRCNSNKRRYGQAIEIEILERFPEGILTLTEISDLEWAHAANYGYALGQRYENSIKASESRLGTNHTEDTKEKMKISATGRTMSDTAKINMSKAFTGRIESKETREKLSKSNNGSKRTDEQKKHFSEVQKALNKTLSQETKDKIRDKLIGTTLSNETKIKIGLQSKGNVNCRDLRTGDKYRVSKEEFDKHDYLVGTSSKKENYK